MIKAEAKDNGKVCTLIIGDADSVFQEFFSIIDHVTKLCMHACKTGDREEFAEALKEEIDKTFAKAIWGD
jgi:hypothetical protein